MKYVFILSFFIASSAFSQDVEWQPLTREISINYKDSAVKARVLINPSEVKVVDEYFYYWHSKGQINRNMGGYSGDILHGAYLVLNSKNKMITQGQFTRGLKTGIWKSWYENGNLKTIENWKNGFLDGKFRSFYEDGSLKEELKYNTGTLIKEEDKSFKIFKTEDKEIPDSMSMHSIPKER